MHAGNTLMGGIVIPGQTVLVFGERDCLLAGATASRVSLTSRQLLLSMIVRHGVDITPLKPGVVIHVIVADDDRYLLINSLFEITGLTLSSLGTKDIAVKLNLGELPFAARAPASYGEGDDEEEINGP